MANVMHLLVSGDYGGIETLAREYASRSRHNNIYVFVLRGGPVAEQMIQNGATVILLHGSSKRPFGTYHMIKKLCRKYSIETVIVQHDSPLLHMCGVWLKRHNKGFELIDYVHRDPVDYLHTGAMVSVIRNHVIRKSFLAADKVIAISQFVKKQTVEVFHIAPEKVTVIYNGVNIEKFSNDNTQHNMNKMLYVGRLEEKKGVQIVLRALARLQSERKVHLTVVGDGSYRSELEKLTNELNLSHMVTFTGMKQNVSEYIKKAGIFVSVPTLDEGFGISVVEALAGGLICVCSKSGALPEIISNDLNGYLVEKNDVVELAGVLSVIIGQDNTRTDTIRKNAIIASTKYDIESYSEKLNLLIGE